MWGVTMRLINPVGLIPVLITGLALSACVTEEMASELSQPNFGRRQLNSNENVDSRLLMNGLYAPKPYGVSPYAATPYAFPMYDGRISLFATSAVGVVFVRSVGCRPPANRPAKCGLTL